MGRNIWAAGSGRSERALGYISSMLSLAGLQVVFLW